jgi:hypothetical protein
MELPLPAVIAAEHEQGRGAADPLLRERAGSQQRIDPRPDRRIVDDHDVALLQVALRRRGEGQRAEGVDQFGFDGLPGEMPARSARGELQPKLGESVGGRKVDLAEAKQVVRKESA